MVPIVYKLDIELQEATFFASHELGEMYFTEALIGNYALAYALGLVKSPYNRTNVGYAEDIPELNQKSIYITPAWPERKPEYRIERFNCQSESFFKAMIPNAVVELAGRQYLQRKGTIAKYMLNGETGKRVAATNRPQTGVLKLLSPLNRFTCCIIATDDVMLPSYIRLGKFMSKARVEYRRITVNRKDSLRAKYKLVNPLDLAPESRILFGDTVNIHPVPLIRGADIEGPWWVTENNAPIVPADMKYRGLE
jgi:CRISPR-associated protein Csc1